MKNFQNLKEAKNQLAKTIDESISTLKEIEDALETEGKTNFERAKITKSLEEFKNYFRRNNSKEISKLINKFIGKIEDLEMFLVKDKYQNERRDYLEKYLTECIELRKKISKFNSP